MMSQQQPMMSMQQPMMGMQQQMAMGGGPQYGMNTQRGSVMGMQQQQQQQQSKGMARPGSSDPFNSLSGFSAPGKR